MRNLLIFIAAFLFCVQLAAQDNNTDNIALGKKYTMSPPPSYRLCTDPEDAVQLTDGKTTKDYFWTQKGTVGWQNVPYALVQIDLEKIEPIGRIEMTTAAGVAGVTWPTAVFVQTSDDGKTFRNAGDLMSLDFKANGPLPEGYAIRCLATDEIRSRGRFVRFIMMSSGPFIFTDEIRIFRGDDSLLALAPTDKKLGEVVSATPKEFIETKRFSIAIQRRYTTDIAELRQVLADAKIAGETHKNLAERIQSLEKEINNAITSQAPPFAQISEGFKTIFPLGTLHQEIFNIHAAIWKAAGLSVHAVPVSPWDKTTLLEIPSKEFLNSQQMIEVHAMNGEYRAAAFNLYNATDKPISVSIKIDGIPATEFAVHDVPWTDTTQFEPVLAALPFAAQKNDVFSVSVLPGLVKQVYLTFRPMNLPPKLYESNIVLDFAGGISKRIPLKLTVWNMKFPEKTSLLVGGWSYTNGTGAYSVNLKNRDSFLKHLQERFVNAPWARPSVVMNYKLDKAANVVTLDTKDMDDWLAQWANAKEYCIFLSVGASISGIKHDAPEFESVVAAWITAWTEHWKVKGIVPERINLLVSDEPGLAFDLTPTFSWCRAIRKAQPKLKLWVDPVYTDLSKAPKEVFELNDVICPNRPQWLQHRAAFDAFYFDWQKQGKTLQLYSCSGPVRLLDPYSYFRLQAWECARIGGTGSFFWAFGDGSGHSSWNEYLAARNMYTPIFIDPNSETVVAGKQMEAVREGTQDFETIQMLRQRIEQRKAAGKPTAEAEAVLKEAIETVFAAEGVDKIFWKDVKDRSIADKARVKILQTILRLND